MHARFKQKHALQFGYLSCQLGLGLVYQAAECSFVVHGQVGQHFTVDFDGSFLQAIGELAVSQAQLTGGCVDAGNPQLAEYALFGAAVTVGILTCLHDGLFGNAEYIAATTAETLGQLQNFLVTGMSRDTTFYARHVLISLQTGKRQHLRHVTEVSLMHIHCAAQVAFVLCALLGQDVALERLTTLDRPTGTHAKTLFRAALAFHFWHKNPTFFV